MKRVAVGLASVLAVACGGDDPADSALQGIYAIDTWTKNEMGCSTEGPDILATRNDKYFYVELYQDLGRRRLYTSRCIDLEECHAEIGDTIVWLGGQGWVSEGGSDRSGWTGATMYASDGAPGSRPCAGGIIDHRMTSTLGDQVRIASETRTAPGGFGKDSYGVCDIDEALAATAGQACEELVVVTGTLVEPL